MVRITDLRAREILDSRGNATIEIDLVVEHDGKKGHGRAAAPSGASRGKHEVVDFPSGGVKAAIQRLEKIGAELKRREFSDQSAFDLALREIDGTENLSRIGGNTTVALSMAFAKAVASLANKPLFQSLNPEAKGLPFPLGNVLGGGKHAGMRAPDIQEFLVIPVGAKNAVEAVFTNSKVHKRVRKTLEKLDPTFTGGKGDEGAWAPNLDSQKALEVVAQVCEEISNETGVEVRAGLDVAASSLYDQEKNLYHYKREGKTRSPGEHLDFIVELIRTYKLAYVEDPIQEEDFEGFAEITAKVGKECLICGDDLFVTNVERIERGLKMKAANSVLIKPNQIGTLTDTLKAIVAAKNHDCVPVVSHRSGETTDETIAHIAVAWGCPLIKTGVVGGERIAKLNELIRIEEMLGAEATMQHLPLK